MWRACDVIAVSMFGLGLRFIHPQPRGLLHRRIFVAFSAIGDAVRLGGEIREAAFTLEGDIRVGVELLGLSPAALAITTVLSGMKRNDAKDATPRLAR